MAAFLALAISLPALGADPDPIAQVLAASPGATFEGKTVSEDMPILVDGILRTSKEGGAKFELAGTKTVVDLAPDSEVRIFRTPVGSSQQQIELIRGMARARVKPFVKPNGPKGAFTLKTKAATMGVRGTDFLGIANPILNEAEIVVFEGRVEFASVADPKDLKMIPAGHWGGIGGRFGAKVSELIQLPAEAIRHFERVSNAAPAFTVKGGKDAKGDSAGSGR